MSSTIIRLSFGYLSVIIRIDMLFTGCKDSAILRDMQEDSGDNLLALRILARFLYCNRCIPVIQTLFEDFNTLLCVALPTFMIVPVGIRTSASASCVNPTLYFGTYTRTCSRFHRVCARYADCAPQEFRCIDSQ